MKPLCVFGLKNIYLFFCFVHMQSYIKEKIDKGENIELVILDRDGLVGNKRMEFPTYILLPLH